MKRVVAATLALALVSPAAWAEPRKILVLQSEGRVDGATRTKIDAAILKLAKTTDAQISPGDITMTDAAAALGCKVDAPACRDEILNMLAVDELVYATLTPKPGGTEIVAFRVAKGGVARDAKASVIAGQPIEKIDGLAPLFFASTTATMPAPSSDPPVAPPPATAPSPAVPPATSATDPAAPAAYPPPALVDQPTSYSRLPLIGMIGGGALVLLGFASWGRASDLQGEIDDHPRNTLADFSALTALEKDADGAAAFGNVLFLGGAILGGVSAYYFIKGRRKQQAARTALVTPTVFDHGAGVTLTIGAAP